MALRPRAAPQRLERKHDLSGLPPQCVFVAVEPVQWEGRQSDQAQETFADVLLQIGAERVGSCGFRVLDHFPMELICRLRIVASDHQCRSRRPASELAGIGGD